VYGSISSCWLMSYASIYFVMIFHHAARPIMSDVIEWYKRMPQLLKYINFEAFCSSQLLVESESSCSTIGAHILYFQFVICDQTTFLHFCYKICTNVKIIMYYLQLMNLKMVQARNLLTHLHVKWQQSRKKFSTSKKRVRKK
jgi:hypothetical protein